jgi:predicted transcriptional regulator
LPQNRSAFISDWQAKAMDSFKNELVKWAQSLPDDCTLDDVESFVRVRREVEAGLKEVDSGQVVSNDEVKQRVAAWLASYGQGVP